MIVVSKDQWARTSSRVGSAKGMYRLCQNTVRGGLQLTFVPFGVSGFRSTQPCGLLLRRTSLQLPFRCLGDLIKQQSQCWYCDQLPMAGLVKQLPERRSITP